MQLTHENWPALFLHLTERNGLLIARSVNSTGSRKPCWQQRRKLHIRQYLVDAAPQEPLTTIIYTLH